MKNLPLLLGTIFGSVALILAVGFFFSRGGQPQTAIADRSVVESNLTKVQGATESAQVTVVEFSDFQCPACQSAAPVVESLAAQYRDTVRFAYRHLPLLSIHPNARPAAIAAEAALKQNAFWPYHDLLFARQDDWADIDSSDELNQKFAVYAEELKLDRTQFEKDLQDQQLAAAVDADAATAQALQVASTPSFFVNGVPATTLDLEDRIISALAEAGATPPAAQQATVSAQPASGSAGL